MDLSNLEFERRKNKLAGFISTCRNRQVVEKSRGNYISANCGKCPDCIRAKSCKYEYLCNNESCNSTYVYFVTLTYADDKVPVMRLQQNGDYIDCIDVTERITLKEKRYTTPVKKLKKVRATLAIKRFPTYGKTINTIKTQLTDEIFQKFYSQAHPPCKTNVNRPFPFLRYCSVRDIQTFLKRLRFYADRYCSSSLRYFAVSEYGPQTFRPHFHLMLFFNESNLSANIQKCVRASWKLGNIRCELANTTNGVAKYCASYTNSLTHCPDYLSSDAVRPRSFHSRFFGRILNQKVRDYFYTDVTRAFTACTVPIGPNGITFLPLGSIVDSLFPRCYNHDNQDSHNLFQLYTIHSVLSNIFPDCNGKSSELTRECIINYEDNQIVNHFLALLDIIPDKHQLDLTYPFLAMPDVATAVSILRYKDLDLDDDLPDDNDDEFLTIYSRIYSAILMSKHFLEFCSRGIGPQTTINIITDYYNKKAQWQLSEQYKYMETYAKYHNLDFDIFWQLDQRYIKHKHALSERYQKTYDASEYIRNINHLKDQMYEDSVKHKKLNDQNLIFVNLI